MQKLTAKLMKEFPDVKVIRKEVWHDEKNMDMVKKCDSDDACGGIPFFFNTKNKKWLCGEVSYGAIKEWAGVNQQDE